MIEIKFVVLLCVIVGIICRYVGYHMGYSAGYYKSGRSRYDQHNWPD
jgi:hypothetical protein